MAEFLHMGGYAFFVWTSFGITFLLMSGAVVFTLMQRNQLKRKLSKRLKQKRGNL